MEHRTIEESIFNPQIHEKVKGERDWRQVFQLDEFSPYALDMGPRTLLLEIKCKGYVSFERGEKMEHAVNRVFIAYQLSYRLKYQIIGPRDVRYILCKWISSH